MPSKKSTKSAATTTTEVPVEPVAPEVLVEVPVTETTAQKFVTVLEKLQGFSNEIKELIITVKLLQKEHVKLVKTTGKKPKKTSNGPRTLSGFAKPSLLSNELCDFMGVAHGTSMARTEVTRMINEYIKTNSLQAAEDKRTIIPDVKLQQILNIGADDKLTYFNLQKFMKHHFTKEA